MEERNLRKTRTGKVVSNKMQKTIVVAVEDHVRHCLLYTSSSTSQRIGASERPDAAAFSFAQETIPLDAST